MAKLMANKNLGSVRTPLHHGTAERAVALAEDAPFIVDVHENAIGTD
jgi:hypothetical protein